MFIVFAREACEGPNTQDQARRLMAPGILERRLAYHPATSQRVHDNSRQDDAMFQQTFENLACFFFGRETHAYCVGDGASNGGNWPPPWRTRWQTIIRPGFAGRVHDGVGDADKLCHPHFFSAVTFEFAFDRSPSVLQARHFRVPAFDQWQSRGLPRTR